MSNSAPLRVHVGAGGALRFRDAFPAIGVQSHAAGDITGHCYVTTNLTEGFTEGFYKIANRPSVSNFWRHDWYC